MREEEKMNTYANATEWRRAQLSIAVSAVALVGIGSAFGGPVTLTTPDVEALSAAIQRGGIVTLAFDGIVKLDARNKASGGTGVTGSAGYVGGGAYGGAMVDAGGTSAVFLSVSSSPIPLSAARK
jgi:hypothetical protein